MVEFCERCKRDTEHAVVKNKRGECKVYCFRCGTIKRQADKIDKAHLRSFTRTSWVEYQKGC